MRLSGLADLSVIIGGPQGSGIETAGQIFMRAVLKSGYHIYGVREYHSNIIGKHSYFIFRIRDRKARSIKYPVHALAALDPETLFTHLDDVMPGGLVIYDGSNPNYRLDRVVSMSPYLKARVKSRLAAYGDTVSGAIDYLRERGVKTLGANYRELLRRVAERIGDVKGLILTRYINTIALGILSHSIGIEFEKYAEAIRDYMRRKPRIAEHNVKAAEVAYEYAERNGPRIYDLRPKEIEGPRMLLTGNDAVAIGKVLGGLRVQTYYPITPAADESFYIEAHELIETESETLEKAGVLIVQTEDEIAAIGMAIGAAIAGARSSTATSGPGFALMVEGLSWAGIAEVPVVITLYQRGGPATGLPTRSGQSELRFALHAGHGEFARIVIASGDHEEALLDAAKAFNYAERFQVPVIHLLEKAIANTLQDVTPPGREDILIDRGKRIERGAPPDYKRYKFTEDHVSPMALPGSGAVFWLEGNEHDEYGHTTEDPLIRTRMYEKRIRKMELINREIPDEEKANFFGSEEPEIMFVSWGSPKGAILDAMEELEDRGYSTGFLQVRFMVPFPSSLVHNRLSRARLVVDVENNFEAQLASLIREKTGLYIKHRILKWTGRSITQDEVVEAALRIVNEGVERVVLTRGE